MATGPINYLRNVTKSIGYAVADIAKEDMAPNISDFAESNKQFIASTYAILRNPSIFIRRSVESIQQSKVYQALDYGAKNLFEDVRSGKFYNKEREDRDSLKYSGLGDFSDMEVDFDFDNFDEPGSESKSKVSSEVTAGDLKIAESVEISSAASANATINAIVKTSDLQVKNARANMGTLYMQNEKLFGGLHQDLSVIGATMDSMHKITSAGIQNIDKNLSDFFTNETKLSQERNNILREMLEIQRRVYTSAADKEKQNAESKSKRFRWSDINSSGLPDFDNYFEAVRKNIKNNLTGGMMGGFSDDSNMLATFMTSPLKEAVKAVVNGVIPSTLKAAVKELDKTVSGIFGTIIARLGTHRGEDSIMGQIAKFLGVSTSVSSRIDTGRYEKGPVPFDGITRKAIIDVIPSYLRRIEAQLSGRPEQTFDYDTGRWVTLRSVKEKYDKIHKDAVRAGTADIREKMEPGLKALRSSNAYENESIEKAGEEFFNYLYTHPEFNAYLSAEKNKVDMSRYPNFYKHYNKIVTIYKNFDKISIQYRGGSKEINNSYSTRMQSAGKIIEARDREERAYRDNEKKTIDTIHQYMSAMSIDAHGKWDKEGKKFTPGQTLLNTRDKIGYSIFDYLQNINKELTWQRQFGFEDLYSLLYSMPGSGKAKNNNANNPTNNPSNGIILSANNDPRSLNRDFNVGLKRDHDATFAGIDLETTQHKNEVTAKNNEEYRKREEKKKKAIEAMKSGKAIDISLFKNDEDAAEDLLEIVKFIQEGNSERFKEEVGEENAPAVARFVEKYFYQTKIKTSKDIREAAEKAEKEAEKEEKKEDKKEKSFINKILGKITQTGSFVGGIAGAASDAFTNVLYAADRAIYEMMFKVKIKNDDDENNDGKKYNGFIDMITHKASDAFTSLKDTIKKDFLDPIKKWLGIDKKDFKEGFGKEIGEVANSLWKSFTDANKETWGKAYEKVMNKDSEDKSIGEKYRQKNRDKYNKDLADAKKLNDIHDKDYTRLLKEYGLNMAHYGTNVEAARRDLEKTIKTHIYESSNNLKEVTNKEELKLAMSAMTKDQMREVAKKYGIRLPEDDNDPGFKSLFASGIEKFKSLTPYGYTAVDKDGNPLTLSDQKKAFREKDGDSLSNREKAINALQASKQITRYTQLGNDPVLSMAKQLGFYANTNEERIALLKALDAQNGTNKFNDKYLEKLLKVDFEKLGVPENASDEIKKRVTEEENRRRLARAFLGNQISNFAKGTVSGKPFMGDTMLSRNELLFNSKGVSRVEKTGAYRLNEPTHILNSEDSYDLMESLGVDKNILGTKSTVQQDLGRENLAKKKYMASLPNHDEGTVKITNNGVDVNAKEILGEAKKFIPEGAAGGLVGGILSMVLGLAGGPIIGAAAGAATSIIRNSDTLKEKLFGKAGEDGKRDGSGIVSKTLVDAAQKYAPDMFKYGLAGIIPGLITPLGPIGGILGGAAIGFLKNNEHFTNKYFGENGKLTLGTKEKDIIQKMLPAGLKGAGVGAVVGMLFGGPFGILGNAAIGSGIGMIASTEEFKDAILGEKVNGVRQGGLLGTIRDAFKPLSDSMKNFATEITDSINRNVIDPLAEFIKPAIHELPRLLGLIPRGIMFVLNKTFGNSLEGKLQDYVLTPLSNGIKKVLTPVTKGVIWALTGPTRFLGKAGRFIRNRQIKRHDADYMTAEERIQWLGENYKNAEPSKYDEFMNNIGTEEGLSLEKAKDLMSNLYRIKDSKDSLSVSKKQQKNAINKILNSYNVDGVGLSKEAKRAVRSALNKDKAEKIPDILKDFGLEGSGAGLTKDQLNNLLNAQGLKEAISGYSSILTREKAIKDKGNASAQAVQESLEALGIEGVDLTKNKDLKRFIKNLETEITNREANGEEKKEEQEQKEEKEYKQQLGGDVHNIALVVNDLADSIISIITGESADVQSTNAMKEGKFFNSKYETNKAYDENLKYAEEKIGAEKFSQLDAKTQDYLSADTRGPQIFDNRFTRKANKDIDHTRINNVAASMNTNVTESRMSVEDVNAVTGNIDRIADIKDKCTEVTYIFDNNAAKNINKLTQGRYKKVYDVLTDYYTQKFCSPKYTVTEDDIEYISQLANKNKLINVMITHVNRNDKMKEFGSFRAASRVKKPKTVEQPASSNNDTVETSTESTATNVQPIPTDTQSEVAKATEQTQTAPVPVQPEPANNGIGTMLLSAIPAVVEGVATVGKMAWNGIKTVASGIGSLAKGAFNLGKNAISSLFGGSKESGGGILSSIGNGAKNLFNKAKSGISNLFHRGGSGGGQFDETDDPNDGKDVVQFGPTLFGKVKKDSSGNIEPDTSDSKTKEAINKLELDEKRNEEAQEAQIKASETLKDAFDVSDNPEAKKKGWSWWQLLLAGGFLWSSGALEKIYNGLIKPLWNGIVVPVWDNFLQPALLNLWNGFSSWFSETAWPWLKDVAFPWINDNVLKPFAKYIAELFGILKSDEEIGYTTKENIDPEYNFTDEEKEKAYTGEYTKDMLYKQAGNNVIGQYIAYRTYRTASTGGALYNRIKEAKEKGYTDEDLANLINNNSAVKNNKYDDANEKLINLYGSDTFKKYMDENKTGSTIHNTPYRLNEEYDNSAFKRGFAYLYGDWGEMTTEDWSNDYNISHNKETNAYEAEQIAIKNDIKTTTKKDENSNIIKKGSGGGFGNNVINASLYALNKGYKGINGGTYPQFFVDYFNKNGYSSNITSDKNTLMKAINSGSPVVLMGQDLNGLSSANPYGKINHYVTATGTDEFGNVIIQNPESPYDNQTYNADELMKKTKLGVYISDKSNTGRGGNNLNGTSVINNTKSVIDSTNSSISKTENEIIDYKDDTETIINNAMSGKISVFSKQYWGNDDNNNSSSFANSIKNFNNKLKKMLYLPFILINNAVNKINGTDTTDNKSTNKSSNNTSNKSTIKDTMNSSFALTFDTINNTLGSIPVIGNIVKTVTSAISGSGKYGRGYSKQIDPSVARIRFNSNGDSEYQTIGDSGCGPVAAVNAMEAMYGRGTNEIVDAASYALNHGYKETNGGTRPQFFTDYFSRNGYASQTTSNKSRLVANIRSGHPTVLMGTDPHGVSSSTPYGRYPHYVTVTGVDRFGRAIVQDPESKYDNQIYSMNDLMSKTQFGISAFGRSKYNKINSSSFKHKKGQIYSKYNRPNKNIKYNKSKNKYGKGTNVNNIINQDLGVFSPLTAADINKFIEGYNSSSPFNGRGDIFIEASNVSGYDPRYILAHAAVESGWGTSDICKDKGNYFGIGAFDGSAYESAYTFGDGSTDVMRAGIVGGAKWIHEEYYEEGQTSLYLMQHCPFNDWHNYCTSSDWANIIAEIMSAMPENTDATLVGSKYDISSSTTSNATTGSSRYSSALKFKADDGKEYTIGQALNNALWNSNAGRVYSSLSSSGSGKYGRGNDDILKHPTYLDENGKINFSAPFTYKEDDSKAPYSDEYREEKDTKIKENNKNALEEYDIKKSIEGKSIFEIFNDLLWNSNAGKVLSSINELSSSISGDILNMKPGDSSSNTSSSAAYAPTTNTKVSGKTASGDPAKLVNIARGEIGTKEADHEGTEDVKYNHWYWGELSNYSGYPWCAAFVSWVADQAGVSTDIIPKSASCPTSYNTILNNGGVRIDPSQAGPGDIVYFTNDGSDRYHIGIVENRQGNTINTIEGNTGGEDGYMVARRQYNQGDSKLVIIHPAYQNTSGQSYDFTMTGEGGNGDKPLSKYGQFKNNIYGKSAMPRTKTIALKSKNGTYNVAYSAEDQLIDQSQKIIRDKNSNKYGKGTTVVSTNNNINTSLINTIINILYTIADNTDKLNTIVSILNQKLGINITSNDISNNSKRETLKAKLQNSLNNSLITSTSKINAYADDAADSSINFIIKAMNAIASE